jgi:hypothetical protein
MGKFSARPPTAGRLDGTARLGALLYWFLVALCVGGTVWGMVLAVHAIYGT